MQSELFLQAKELILRSKNILIVLGPKQTTDDLAAAASLFNVLQDIGQQTSFFCPDFDQDLEVDFFKISASFKKEITVLRKNVLNLDISRSGIKDFSYQLEGNNLKIFITPEKNFLTENDIKLETTNFIFNLVITFGLQKIEQLEDFYSSQLDFLQQTPIINFSIHPANTHFGQINLVDIKAVAVCQLLYNFISSHFKTLITSQVATNLLAGMMTKTRAFKTTNITPEALYVASDLIAQGADRAAITRHFFQSKKISTLKLWGRLLTKLQQDKSIKLVWSLLKHEDFVKAGATVTAVRGVVEELVSAVPGAEIVLVLFEQPLPASDQLKISAQVFSSPNYDSLDILSFFDPQGSADFASFDVPCSNLFEAEKMVIDVIRQQLS